MLYSYFDSIKSKKCQQMTVEQLFDRVKQQDIQRICSQILAFLNEGKEEEASKLKAQLPVIVLGQLYENGQPRSKNGGKPTGLLMIDYDDCKTDEEAQALMLHIKEKYLSDLYLQDIIVAAHFSPRKHGVHIWYRWLDGCTSYEECNSRLAALLDRPDYDQSCKDNSRCSFLVPDDYFFITNMDAMQNNEPFAELQEKQENKNGHNNQSRSDGSGKSDGNDRSDDSRRRAKKEYPLEYNGITYSRIVRELTIRCTPKQNLDENYNVLPGSRDNTFFQLAVLLRYICDNDPYWIQSLAPDWAFELENEVPGRVLDICKAACTKTRGFGFPRTLEEALTSLADEDLELLEETDEEVTDAKQQKYVEELEEIEEEKLKFITTPEVLPPIFQQYCDAVKPEWRPAVILALLPTLGTIMSKLRSRYLDNRLHSPSFQTVIEAPMGAGKGNLMDIANQILEPLTAKEAEGNALINMYNKQVIKNNGSKELADRPEPCLRKIIGEFTEAGLNEIIDHSCGLHIWSGVCEIDQVASSWKRMSYILRLAYDNAMYGRTIQSPRQFRGERPLFLNAFLCGTPNAVKAVYDNPEDGLVSRTMFFMLLHETCDIPLTRISGNELRKIRNLCKKLHDQYTINDDDVVAMEQVINLNYINKHLQKWLLDKYMESNRFGSDAKERFRRRDAVNGFRAGMVAHAIYLATGKKITDKEREVVKQFAEWVASYSLMMHEYKFGEQLNEILQQCKKIVIRKETPMIQKFPDHFTIAEAYATFPSSPQSTVRANIARLVANGELECIERGVYKKTNI